MPPDQQQGRPDGRAASPDATRAEFKSTSTLDDDGDKYWRKRIIGLPRVSDEEYERRVAEMDAAEIRSRGRNGIKFIGRGQPDEQWSAVVQALVEHGAIHRGDWSEAAKSLWVKNFTCPECGSSSGYARRDKVRDFALNQIRVTCSSGSGCGTRKVLTRLGLAVAEQVTVIEATDPGRDLAAGVADATPIEGTTWRPVDLGPYLRGEITRPEPTVGVARVDGLRLLYPAKEHAVIGEMESGKSWLALACVAAELTKGNRVVYVHAEESDPTDTVERLQALGISDADILERFAFAGPIEPVDPYALAALLDPAPSLVILDGVNELMSLHGQGIRDEDGVAAFRRRLVKPCTAVGAAVLACDHVVKDRERRGRDALGSIHKGNGLTGSLIALDNVAPFGRGARGCSHVYVTKDRPGHLRRHGRPSKLPGKTYMGSLIVDDERTWTDGLSLAFIEPPDEAQPETTVNRDQADDDAILTLVAELGIAETQASLRTIRAKAGMNKDRVADALTRLLLDGRLTEREGPRRSRLFTVAEGQPQ